MPLGASTEVGKPRLFVYSLLLPIFWTGLGWTVQLVAPGKKLGIFGPAIILYAMVGIVSWHFARKFRRTFSRAETLKLIVYCTFWAMSSESLGLYSTVAEESASMPLTKGTVVWALAFALVVDTLFIWLGFAVLSKRFIGDFLKKAHGESPNTSLERTRGE